MVYGPIATYLVELFPTRIRYTSMSLPCHNLIEGINNRIKMIKRMAYGFRDDAYFFLKIRGAFPGKAG